MSLILLLIIAGINVDVFDTSNDDVSCNIVALASNAVVGSLEHLKSSEFPAPPTNVLPKDKPNDAGGSIILTWMKSVDDVEENELVKEYQVFRSSSLDREFELIGTASKGFEKYVDGTTIDGTQYYYMVKASDGVSYSQPARSEAVSSSAQWFHTGRINMLVATVIISFLILWFIRQAKSGKELYIRPIAGLEAVDDAVGRATEMGKPIMYIPGIMDMDNMQTIASVIILGRVARKAAQYETTLLVPCCRSIVMSAAQETVKEAYFDAGRPDAFNADKINYLTDDQFGYAAGVNGMMLREKPGAIFYMGAFYAESLILAETGHSTGAIQIAGTAMPSQLPFFVTACDYTLIGEELFAASAYLSKEPLLLGSLKGQDMGKAILIAILVGGVILVSFGFSKIIAWLTTG
ncbi:MAG: hypothetical protein E3J47_06580 [Candidatus Stahlbacteria bacterium]|nr:MAG: hypothetical protein E3J47_06580 [Candidatus Stahlbacteria bacterium]